MNSKLQNQPQTQSFDAFVNGNNDSFNFDRWAIEVRQQMLEILQKKALKGKRKVAKKE